MPGKFPQYFFYVNNERKKLWAAFTILNKTLFIFVKYYFFTTYVQ